MYANPNNCTYSSSPEDNECDDGSLLSCSFFDRVDALSHARGTVDVSSSPPLMTSGGGGLLLNPFTQGVVGGGHEEKMGSMNSTINGVSGGKMQPPPFFHQDANNNNDDGGGGSGAPFNFQSGFLEGSSMGSTVSNIIASHKSLNTDRQQQHQQQGYGQLQEQYGYNTPMNPPELLTSGGVTTNSTTNNSKDTAQKGPSTLSNSTDKSSGNSNMGENAPETNSTSSNNNGGGGNEQSYQEIMSTPSLPNTTNTNKPAENNESNMDEMNQQQWTDSGNSTPVPAAPASSSLQQPSQPNEGGDDTTSPLPPVSSSSSLPTTNSNKTNQPVVFHGKGSFPLNLALMLESVEHPWTYDDASIPGSEDGKMNHIVSWLPCGSGFVIHRTDLFLSEALPRFFKSSKNTKLRSFYRKLNRWGFSVLRSSQLNQEGIISSVKNAWQHPDFSRDRAVDCLMRAQKSGDTDYSHMLSVTHVSFGESSNGGRGTPGSTGGKKRSAKKRNSDYSIESSCSRNTMDMDDMTRDKFNASFPALDRIGVSNKRRESLQDPAQRMSWTAGAGPSSLELNNSSWATYSSGVGGSAVVNNAAATKQLTDLLNLSWTTGSNPVSNATTSASSQTPLQLNQSWSAGRNSLPDTSASAAQLNQSWSAGNTSAQQLNQQLNQSWTTSGYTPNNASQLSHIQFNQLMNNPVSNSSTTATDSSNSNGYNEWKNMVMQSNGNGQGSTIGQEQQQQTWGNSSNVSQVAQTYVPHSKTNGNSFNPLAQMSAQVTESQEQQQQWSQLNQHQNQQGQMNGFQQQPQGNGLGRSQQELEELTQQDDDLRVFFERFAERMGKDDEK